MANNRGRLRRKLFRAPTVIDLSDQPEVIDPPDAVTLWLQTHPPPPPETSVYICPPGVPPERAVPARTLPPHALREIAAEANTRELLRIFCRRRRPSDPYGPAPPPPLPPDLARNFLRRYRQNRDHDISFAREILQRRNWERQYRELIDAQASAPSP
jgi:hypothetical protein